MRGCPLGRLGVAKEGAVLLPVTEELLGDSLPLGLLVAQGFAWMVATAAGRVVYRGGGWWRVDGEQVRGRRAARQKVWERSGDGQLR